MTQAIKKGRIGFSSELPTELMEAMDSIAKADGCDSQTVLEDAVRRYL